MFEKTLEFADGIDEGLKNTALKVVEKGIKPAFEALGDVELGSLGRRPRLGLI